MGEGRSAKNIMGDRSAVETGLSQERGRQLSPQLAQAMQQYASGQLDRNQALQLAGGGMEAQEALATGPGTAQRFATEQLQRDPITGQMFGAGGLQERLGAEEKQLAGRGYSMQPEDYEAYGQASADIARRSGQEEGSLARSLAARGLGGTASGMAQKAYSGAGGNKFERLASAQRQIADDRMARNMQRLQQTRQAAMQATQMGMQGQGQLTEQAMGARKQRGSELGSEADREAARREAQQGQLNTEFQQIESTRGPSLGEILGGVGTGLIGLATGGVGTALGAGLGGAVGGLFGGGNKPPLSQQAKRMPTGQKVAMNPIAAGQQAAGQQDLDLWQRALTKNPKMSTFNAGLQSYPNRTEF